MGPPAPRYRVVADGFIMRSTLIAVVSLLVMGLVFWLYLSMQPPPRPSGQAGQQPPSTATLSQGQRIAGAVGRGQGVWVATLDQKSGQLLSRFRAKEYNPQGDDRVRVVAPEAEFYLGSDRQQVIRIRGHSGIVTLQQAPQRVSASFNSGENTSAQPPSRGQLKDVVIDLFNTPQDMDHDAPALRVTMNNAAFDNESFRIFTEAYQEEAKTVAADRVPVVLRGRDYDFEGQGLTVRWNERDRRLEMLQIHHGGTLRIKHPPAALTGKSATSTQTATTQPASRPAIASTAPTTTPADATQPTQTAQAYRARFQSNVHIVQGDRELAAADELSVDFPMTGMEPRRKAMVPAGDPANSEISPAATGPATTSSIAPVSDDTAPSATTQLATPPAAAEPPIVITWSGPLEVVPATEAPPPGDAIVRLSGQPLVLHHGQGTIHCQQATYHSAGGQLLLLGDEQSPLVMGDQSGSRIITRRLDFDPAARLARLSGPSSATFVSTSQAGAKETLTAHWQQTCDLHFSNLAAQGALELESATLRGQVRLEHPQIRSFEAQLLELDFASVASSSTSGASTTPAPIGTTATSRPAMPSLRRLRAQGKVRCLLAQADQPLGGIECGELILMADADAKTPFSPRHILASENVHAFDSQQFLKCQQLDLVLENVPQTGQADPAKALAAIRHLTATGQVSAQLNNNGTFQGDLLVLEGTEGNIVEAHVAGKPAQLSDKQTTLTGDDIVYRPLAQSAIVQGPGTLVSKPVVRQEESALDRNLAASWQSGAKLDGEHNRLTVRGKVLLTSRQPDGADSQVACDQAIFLLQSSASASTHRAATQPANPLAGDFLAGKSLSAIELKALSPQEPVQLTNRWLTSDGTLARRLAIFCDQARYELPAGDRSAQSNGRFTVPGAGRMLWEDHRPAPVATAPVAATNPVLTAGSDSRGRTAITWNDQLLYDAASGQINLQGKVLLRHQPEQHDGKSFDLQADQLTALLAERPAASTHPASRPAEPTASIAKLTARGNVQFLAEQAELTAALIEYNPAAHLLTASGGENQPVRVEKGVNTGSFEQVQFNTLTEQLLITQFRSGAGRD